MTTELTRADAKQRAGRTLVQGMLASLGVGTLVAIATGVLPLITSAQPSELFTPQLWITIAAVATQTGLTAVVSYLSRLQAPPAPLELAPESE